MYIGFCHVYIYMYFFSLEWILSKVERDMSILKEVFMIAKLLFQKPAQIYNTVINLCFLIPSLCWLSLKNPKILLLRLNKFSVWQLLKNFCLLTSMSVGMCNRNSFYQRKTVIQFTKMGRKTD